MPSYQSPSNLLPHFSTNKGAIIGGAVGGVVLLVVVAFLLVFFFRWRRKRNLRHAAQHSANPFVMSAGSDISSPFGEEYAVRYSTSRDAGSTKSTNLDSQLSHQPNPSMGSVSSSITDSSTQQLVSGSHGENAFPMSRLPHVASSSSIPSTSENPSPSLHPNIDYYYAHNRTPSGSSVQTQSAFTPSFPPSNTLDVPIPGAQEASRSSSPSRPRTDISETQAQIHAILGGPPSRLPPPSSLAPPAEGASSSSTPSMTPTPSVTPPASQSPTPVLKRRMLGA
jgi:hypothetical protein